VPQGVFADTVRRVQQVVVAVQDAVDRNASPTQVFRRRKDESSRNALTTHFAGGPDLTLLGTDPVGNPEAGMPFETRKRVRRLRVPAKNLVNLGFDSRRAWIGPTVSSDRPDHAAYVAGAVRTCRGVKKIRRTNNKPHHQITSRTGDLVPR